LGLLDIWNSIDFFVFRLQRYNIFGKYLGLIVILQAETWL